MEGIINGQAFKADWVFFDGCHKFYIADTENGMQHMFEIGWDDEDMFRIEELPELWVSSCPLRFIMSADLERGFVAQFEPAEFEGWDISAGLASELEELRLAEY